MGNGRPARGCNAGEAEAVCPGGRTVNNPNALVLQGLSRQVHALGARVFFELLTEISRSLQAGEVVAAILVKYAERLTPELLAVTGGDRFAVPPVHLVRR